MANTNICLQEITLHDDELLGMGGRVVTLV